MSPDRLQPPQPESEPTAPPPQLMDRPVEPEATDEQVLERALARMPALLASVRDESFEHDIAPLETEFSQDPKNTIKPTSYRLALGETTRHLPEPEDKKAAIATLMIVRRLEGYFAEAGVAAGTAISQEGIDALAVSSTRMRNFLSQAAWKRIPETVIRSLVNESLTRQLWGKASRFELLAGQVMWIGSQPTHELETTTERVLSREEFIGQLGVTLALLGCVGMSKNNKNYLIAVGNLKSSQELADTPAVQLHRVMELLYTNYLSHQDVYLAKAYATGYRQHSVRLEAERRLFDPSAPKDEVPNETHLLNQLTKVLLEVQTQFEEEPLTEVTARRLVSEFFDHGIRQATIDAVDLAESKPYVQPNGTEVQRAAASVLEKIVTFRNALEELSIRTASGDSFRRDSLNEAQRQNLFELAQQVVREFPVGSEGLRYLLLAIDDTQDDQPQSEAIQIARGQITVPVHRFLRERIIDRLGWRDWETFIREVELTLVALDLSNGLPESAINLCLVSPKDFARNVIQDVLKGDETRVHLLLTLLQRMLIVPNERLREQAKKVVEMVLRNSSLQEKCIERPQLFDLVNEVIWLLPLAEQERIVSQLYGRIRVLLSSLESQIPKELAWSLRLRLSIGFYLGPNDSFDDLYPASKVTPPPSAPSPTAPEQEDRSFAAWEERFPELGASGDLGLYKKLFGLDALVAGESVEDWLELCNERAFIVGDDVQRLNAAGTHSGTGDFGVEAARLAKLLDLQSFRWTLDGDALTVSFPLKEGREMTFQMSLPEQPFTPSSVRTAFFEPYLRAAVLQIIYRQLSGDQATDALADIESYHLNCVGALETTQVGDTDDTSELFPLADESTPFTMDASYEELMSRLMPPEVIQPVDPREQWRDRTLTTPEEFAGFFNGVLPLPLLKVGELDLLETSRASLVLNLHSDQIGRALPSDGVTVFVEGGHWRKRSDWDVQTGVNRVELFPASEGSTNLARVRIHCLNNVTIETVVEFDGFLSLGSGLDLEQRTPIELVVLRCLEQERTLPLTPPPDTVASSAVSSHRTAASGPDASKTVPRHVRLREDDRHDRKRRQQARQQATSSPELEALGKRTMPGQRVWAGYSRNPETGQLEGKNPTPKKEKYAADQGITLDTGTRSNPDFPGEPDRQRIVMRMTWRDEHLHSILRKKPGVVRRLTDEG